jgi:predicted nucleic acid-binding protein
MPDELPGPTAFVDTNGLYAFITSDDAAKTARASSLLQTIKPVVNVQVVNEVCVKLLRRKVLTEAKFQS